MSGAGIANLAEFFDILARLAVLNPEEKYFKDASHQGWEQRAPIGRKGAIR
jgi:hypothetical protein